MDNTLVYEAGDCGSIPYKGTTAPLVKKYNTVLITQNRRSITSWGYQIWAASIMGLHWPCKSVIGVRFPSGPPSLSVCEKVWSNLLALEVRNRRFKSCHTDQLTGNTLQGEAPVFCIRICTAKSKLIGSIPIFPANLCCS